MFSNDSLYIEISKGPQKGKRIRINSVMYATRAVLADSAVSTQRSESSRFSEASLFSDSTKASYRAKTSVTAQKADTSEFSKTSAFSDSTNKSYRALTAGIADSAIKTGGQIWSKKNITAYYNDGNLGIGTDSAKEKLDVVGNIMAENPSGDANMFLVASSNPALCLKQKSGSNILNRAKLVYSNNALYLNLWDSMGVQESPGVVVFRQKDVVLDAKGTIKAVNFMVDNVTLNVPDYVFDSGYNLKPLDDVENYINVNHHLPGLPGADEIKKNGMDLTQMNLKLLEKIEELTLHVINQNKKIIKLEKAVQGKQRSMRNFLERIIAEKKIEVKKHKKERPQKELSLSFKNKRSFSKALKGSRVRVIAEVKKASPSKGIIDKDFDYLNIAQAYQRNGAAAVSVLTEEKFFLGSLKILDEISRYVKIPVLRKDFIIDDYQIYESVHFGADAVLLITSILDSKQLVDYISLSLSLGLSPLVEVHNRKELEKALKCGARIIGVNNRNLKTFKVDIKTSLDLIQYTDDKECILVSESGITNRSDARLLKDAGFDAVLIGETFMREKNKGSRIREFII